MINFKQVTLEDKKAIDACLTNNTCRACDYTFANLLCWSPKFKTVFAIEDKTLFVRFQASEDEIYYLMPVGKMPADKALKMLIADAEKIGIPFQMKAVTSCLWDRVEADVKKQFEYIPDRDNSEYIYLSEKLAKLSGKKLQKKRNHLNRFKADNPSWQYFPLPTQDDFGECLAMLEDWIKEDHSDENDSLEYDDIATRMMLKNFHTLELKGGGVRVNGKLVGFTIGSRLTEDTFAVHVEKAFAAINGSYGIINQQFVEHELSEYTYVNREEDMGVESLRKAKLSYYPEIILEEGIVRLK